VYPSPARSATARRRISRPSIAHGDPSSMRKSHSTAAVSGRQGSCTTVSRSGTAENFGKPLSKLLQGESVISSPPRNDMINVLIPVPVGPSPFGRLAILPRTVPLMSGISIWITRTPCSRRRSVISRPLAARDCPRGSSRLFFSITLPAGRPATFYNAPRWPPGHIP
jgi:hypothetical protein